MNKLAMILMCCGFIMFSVKSWAIDKKLLDELHPYPHQQQYSGPITDDVRIVFSGAYMPLERFILLRRKTQMCAIKFIRFCNEKEKENIEKYAEYISYYQNDGSDNFLNQQVKITKGKASNLPLRGWCRIDTGQPGITYIKCGPLKLAWQFYGFVAAFENRASPSEHGFEFAPTPWENINQVNISDKRIKWYRYDKNRKTVDIPIDKLWEETSP